MKPLLKAGQDNLQKISVDTNVLLRILMQDDPAQMEIANNLLEQADAVAVSNTCLCEVVWVLGKSYRLSSSEILVLLENLLAMDKLVIDFETVEFALEILRDGGDFADGVIAYQGHLLGGDTFMSFDRKAVHLLQKHGQTAVLLGKNLN